MKQGQESNEAAFLRFILAPSQMEGRLGGQF